jgi:hypothetical protein
MKFTIYHRDEMAFLTDEEPAKNFPEGYTKVAVVEADNLGDTFRITNNIEESWTHNPEVRELLVQRPRSTSVGDVVVSNDEDKVFLCACMGWDEINVKEAV